MLVWKSGRTTGRTEGFIDGLNLAHEITPVLGGFASRFLKIC
jgi:hypothetical protein